MTHENIATPRSKLVRDAILKYIYLETKKDPHNERPFLHLDGIAELANVPGEALTQQEVDDEARSLVDDGCIDGDLSAQRFAPTRAILTPRGKDIAAGLFTGDDESPVIVRVMAELDYAFIAEFAKVEGSGTLTAVGASYLEVRPPAFPIQHAFSVAGRIRAPEDTEPIALVIRINPPGNMNIVLNGTLTPGAESVRYDGKVAIVFAATVSIALAAPGLCEVFIDVDGRQQRRLAFSIVAPQ